MTDAEKIAAVLAEIDQYGGIDGSHHKQYCLDQVVRILTGCPKEQRTAIDVRGKEYEYESLGESAEYKAWVQKREDEGYDWSTGITP